jgi:predicted HAD superfamily Cof-like phosphohydrolase
MTSFDIMCSQVSVFNYVFGVIDYQYSSNIINNNTSLIHKDKFVNNQNNNNNQFNTNQIKLRYSLIEEEVKELIKAFEDKDIVEIIDALCDILYVVCGAKVYFNLHNNKVNTKINNIEKIHNQYFTTKEELINNTIFENYINNVRGIRYHTDILQKLTQNILEQSYNDINELILDYNNILDEISVRVFEIANKLNIDIGYYFRLVHESNMTKVCKTEEIAKNTVEWYKINENRYKQPVYKRVECDGEYYVVYDGETKKILKSIEYQPVRIFNN